MNDIDIYCAEDVLWAIATRVAPARGIIRGQGEAHALMPVARHNPDVEAIGIDAAAPFDGKFAFE